MNNILRFSNYYTNFKSNPLIKNINLDLFNKNKFCFLYNIVNKNRFSSNRINKEKATNNIELNPENILKSRKSIIEYFPISIQNYLYLSRMDKPIGWILLFYPCIWGLVAGYPLLNSESLKHAFLFLVGSITMRSCGCVINDICDRNYDKKVKRTKGRPIASGKISVKKAIGYTIIHFVLGLSILLQFNTKCLITGFFITPFFIIYPLIKRVSYYPQIILGICFSSGILIGYSSIFINNNLLNCLPLYISGVLWTIIYDTIYGHMDKYDDINANIKGTAIKFGQYTYYISYLLLFLIFCLMVYYIEQDKYIRFKKLEKYLQSKLTIDYNNINTINKNVNIYSFNYNKEFYIPYLVLILGIIYQYKLLKNCNINQPISCLNTFKKSSNFGIFIIIFLISNNLVNNRYVNYSIDI